MIGTRGPSSEGGPGNPPISRRVMLRNAAFFQLYRARLREFWRQPARIFWVYGFPTILAIILGLAFQSRPPAPVPVDLVQGPGSATIKAAIEAHNASLEREKSAGKPRMYVPPVVIHEAGQPE